MRNLAIRPNQTALEAHFAPFRENTIGIEQAFETPYGIKKIVYADWTASGRLYAPIESLISQEIGPFVGNTHTETTVTGNAMTQAYHHAKAIIKNHVGARKEDVLIASNSGMTGVVNKFQRILGLKVHERHRNRIQLPEEERPVVFVTHMEHHSNQTSWLETIVDLEVIAPTEEGLVDLEHLELLLSRYRARKTKIAAVTSCSNVTGIFTPYHQIAEIMHRHEGLCFVDFACSAPYIDICMHPAQPGQHLDAIYFSPHKFLGGPGAAGILIFDPNLYKNQVPDNPGGGTVDWTNPWGGHKYIDEIEAREDGGTPAFLQTIKVALAIQLKEQMGVKAILDREHEMMERVWKRIKAIPNLHVLAPQHRDRLGIVSFYIDGLHYNLGVRLLNDRYGIQVRGGCSCAGTYGHYLLHVSQEHSARITNQISRGDLSEKPGWIRLSIHPILTDVEVSTILDAIEELAAHFQEWGRAYRYDPKTNEYHHEQNFGVEQALIENWFGKNLG
jgi:selenocysteine lyase/cysteine desulfurase